MRTSSHGAARSPIFRPRAILQIETSTQRTLEALWRARVPFTLTQDGRGWTMTLKQEPTGDVLKGRARLLDEAVAWVNEQVRRGLGPRLR